jgi:hypothetical protein
MDGSERFATRASVFGLAALSLVVAGCGSGDKGTPPKREGGVPAGFKKNAAGQAAVNLPLVAPKSDLDIPTFSDIIQVDPGADVTFCTFADVILDEPTIFGESFGAQSPQGHHGILQYTATPQEPHTGPCGAMDGNMLLGGTGGKEVSDKTRLPAELGVEAPAGARRKSSTATGSTSEKQVDGQTMMLARRCRGGDTVLAGNLPMVGFGWEIPASGTLSYTTECTYGADVPRPRARAHARVQAHVSIEVDADGTGNEMLIDEEWTKDSATTAGGGTIFSLEDPYMIHQGDTVRLTCNWRNTTADAIGFPREMASSSATPSTRTTCANSLRERRSGLRRMKGDIIAPLSSTGRFARVKSRIAMTAVM